MKEIMDIGHHGEDLWTPPVVYRYGIPMMIIQCLHSIDLCLLYYKITDVRQIYEKGVIIMLDTRNA